MGAIAGAALLVIIWFCVSAISYVCAGIDLDREIYSMIPAHKYPSAIPITVLTLFTIFAALGAFTGILLARKYQRAPNVSDDVKHPLD